jgi:hypothetical protein
VCVRACVGARVRVIKDLSHTHTQSDTIFLDSNTKFWKELRAPTSLRTLHRICLDYPEL